MHRADRASKSRRSAEAQRESAHYSWVQPGWLARRGVKVCASSRFSITALMRSCAQEAIPYSRPEDLYCLAHALTRSHLCAPRYTAAGCVRSSPSGHRASEQGNKDRKERERAYGMRLHSRCIVCSPQL